MKGNAMRFNGSHHGILNAWALCTVLSVFAGGAVVAQTNGGDYEIEVSSNSTETLSLLTLEEAEWPCESVDGTPCYAAIAVFSMPVSLPAVEPWTAELLLVLDNNTIAQPVRIMCFESRDSATSFLEGRTEERGIHRWTGHMTSGENVLDATGALQRVWSHSSDVVFVIATPTPVNIESASMSVKISEGDAAVIDQAFNTSDETPAALAGTDTECCQQGDVRLCITAPTSLCRGDTTTVNTEIWVYNCQNYRNKVVEVCLVENDGVINDEIGCLDVTVSSTCSGTTSWNGSFSNVNIGHFEPVGDAELRGEAGLDCGFFGCKDKCETNDIPVILPSEAVFAPALPSGPSSLCVNESGSFSASGASNSCGHSLQYQFDWGNGQSIWGSSSQSWSWSSSGTQCVKARARCSLHTSIVSNWSSCKNVSITAESVFTPGSPSGSSSLCVGESASYSVSGASSTCGHSVQYQFDWGDGQSSWGSSSQAYSWSSPGTKCVKARARCSTHTSILSNWSSCKNVSINTESVSTPVTPSGSGSLCVGESASFSASSASSTCGHSVQYQFDWGDGQSSWGSSSQAYSWSSPGTKCVKARARCSTHTSILSNWSSCRNVSVNTESVSAPGTPSGPGSLCVEGESGTFSASGASSTCGHLLEHQFDWGDGSQSNWGPSSQSYLWASSGTKCVKARARCSAHTSVVSGWSNCKTVTLSGESVSVPSTPSGPSSLCADTIGTFSVSGASSTCGHTPEYQFEWGDGTQSTWGASSRPYTWASSGSKCVKARARCTTHNDVISSWSGCLNVVIGAAPQWYRDQDGDGFGNKNASPVDACTQPSGHVSNNTDCNDSDSTIYPGAPEPCDGVDHNCDQQIATARSWCRDADGDGYGNAENRQDACQRPAGYVADCRDCNDSSSAIHPGATDVPDNGIDEDCDGRDPTVDCTSSISPTSRSFEAAGGIGSIAVTVNSGCAWTATPGPNWITISSGSPGSGNGTVNYSVAAHTGTSTRSGTITVAGRTFTVTQNPIDCTASISPSNRSFDAAGGTGSIAVTLNSGCLRTATSNATWINVTSGSNGSGNGTVNYSVAAHTGTSSRSGTITVAGKTFTVTQSPDCTASITPGSRSFEAEGGAGSVSLTLASGCSWTAGSNDSWITVNSGSSSGSGSAVILYSVSPYTGSTSRSGTITVAGRTHTVTQEPPPPPQTGSITVFIVPQSAVDAGAQWRRAETQTWRNSGQREDGLEIGYTYAIEFNSPSGWSPPIVFSASPNALNPALALTAEFDEVVCAPGPPCGTGTCQAMIASGLALWFMPRRRRWWSRR